MSYPVELLTTEIEHDTVLDEGADELRDLRVNETILAAQSERTSDTAAATTAELTAQQAIITALTPVVPTMPAGSKARLDTEADLRHASQRHENLTASQQSRGPVAALRRARQLRQVRVQIAEVETFIAEVTTHKAEMAAAGWPA